MLSCPSAGWEWSVEKSHRGEVYCKCARQTGRQSAAARGHGAICTEDIVRSMSAFWFALCPAPYFSGIHLSVFREGMLCSTF